MSHPAASSRVYYGWWIVAASFTLMFASYGIQYSFGVYLKPLCAEFQWSRAVTSGVFSLSLLTYSLSAVAMGALTDRYGPRIVCTVGVLLMAVGVILASLASAVWHLYLTYGFILGIGAGALFAPLLGTVTRFFVRRRGLAVGIAMSGIGAGTFVMLPVSQYLINSQGWRMAYVLTGLLPIVVGLPMAAIVMRRSPEDMGLASEAEATSPSNPQPQGYSLAEALRTLPFWMVFSMYIGAAVGLMGITAHLVAYAADSGISEMVAATAMGFMGLSGMAGRIGIGALSDRIGRKHALFISLGLLMLTMFWLLAVKSTAMLWVWVTVYGFLYGGTGASMVGLAADVFRGKAISTILGAFEIAFGIGGVIGPWIAGFIFDTTLSYAIAFLVFALAFFLAGVFTFFVRVRKQPA